MLDKTGISKRVRLRSLGGWTMALALGAITLIAGQSCGAEDEGITYRRHVRPIFSGRCTICHYSGGPIPADIENPFASGTGLIDSINTWAEPNAYPGLSPEQNVEPGSPELSFLINKISNPALNTVPDPGGGAYMPLNFELLNETELGFVEKWVLDGANNDDFYQQNVQPIFGSGTLGRPGKCSYCHYEGSPSPPNLINPFDPIDGVVGIISSDRSDLQLVNPGNPDESLLVLKVRAREDSGEIGQTMPYAYPALSEEQVDIVTEWIRLGALNN